MVGKQCAICKRFEEDVGKLTLSNVPVLCVDTGEVNNASETTYKKLWLCKNCGLKFAVVNKRQVQAV